jgi:uncharacterized membrane protein YeaQ/YmgE (transglycosylase-associated protein family)
LRKSLYIAYALQTYKQKAVYLMLSVLFWISFGGLVGWVAAIVKGEGTLRYTVMYALIGMAGGLLGGYTGGQLSTEALEHTASSTAMMFAIFGAITFVILAGLASSKHSE